jgi:hypothetical protein
MKNNVKACCLHQKELFQSITSIRDYQSLFRSDNPQPPQMSKNNNSPSKIKHANAVYDKWKSKKSQENYLRHLSLSY